MIPGIATKSLSSLGGNQPRRGLAPHRTSLSPGPSIRNKYQVPVLIKEITDNWPKLSFDKMSMILGMVEHQSSKQRNKYNTLSVKDRAKRDLIHILRMEPVAPLHELWFKTIDRVQKLNGNLRSPNRFLKPIYKALSALHIDRKLYTPSSERSLGHWSL